jgi:hypothetical protein
MPRQNEYRIVIDGNSAYYGAIGKVIGKSQRDEYPMLRLRLMADPMPGERWFLIEALRPVDAATGKAHDARWASALGRAES